MKLTEIQDYTLNKDYPLAPEQQEGVKFLVSKVRAVLGFQTGLGKTYTIATALCHALSIKPNIRGIIVCPINALGIFERELVEKLGFKAEDIGWITNQRMEYDEKTNKVFIFTYTALKEYFSLVESLSQRYMLVAIIDEAHKLNAKDTQTKEVLNNLKPKFSVIWLSTATPLLNDIEGLYNLISYVEPNLFRNKTDFYNRYVESRLKEIYIKGGKGKKKMVRETIGYKNLDSLKQLITNICIIRNRKYNLKYAYLTDSLTKEESEIYNKASEGVLSDEERPFGARMFDLQRIVDNSYTASVLNDRSDDSTKETLLLNSLTKIMTKDFAVVIYVEYLDTLARVEEVLERNKDKIGYNTIHKIQGSVKQEDREYIENAILPKDLILITSAGTQSLNLQKANCVLFYDIPFSVGTIIQVIGRVTRINSKYDVHYVFVLYMKNTIDEYKYILFLDNASLIYQTVGGENMPGNIQETDKKNLQLLKDKYLWHYKGLDKKEAIKHRAMVKNNLVCCTSTNYLESPSMYYIDLGHPNKTPAMGTKRIPGLLMNTMVYDMVDNDSKKKSIFRTKYFDYLKSESVEKSGVLKVITDMIISKKDTVVLVDDYGAGSALKELIISSLG